MTTLYIIGNGFDRWHELPTRYQDFYDFAQEKLDEISDYYLLDWSREDSPWHDFENALGAFNWREFYETHNNVDVHSEKFSTSSAYGLTDDLNEQGNNFVDEIKELFQEWISEIEISVAKKQMSFEDGSKFINFNYTSTLQSIYDIPDGRIFHIHGKAEGYDDLIFGHGKTMEEMPELDENGDSNRTMFSDAEAAAKYPFYALQKPVDKVLKEHELFFRSLSLIRKIIVIGHSLNKIDLPYFKEIAKQSPDANWTICIYKTQDKNNVIQALCKCGIRAEKIVVCSYSDLEK